MILIVLLEPRERATADHRIGWCACTRSRLSAAFSQLPRSVSVRLVLEIWKAAMESFFALLKKTAMGFPSCRARIG